MKQFDYKNFNVNCVKMNFATIGCARCTTASIRTKYKNFVSFSSEITCSIIREMEVIKIII